MRDTIELLLLSGLVVWTLSAWASETSQLSTLGRSDLPGTWVSNEPTASYSLEIASDLSAIWRLQYTDGTSRTSEIASANVRLLDDILIIESVDSDGIGEKFVLSGWKSGDTYQLFVMKYLYGPTGAEKPALFNGVNVYFEREGSTKPYDLLELSDFPTTAEISQQEFDAIVSGLERTPGVKKAVQDNSMWYFHSFWTMIAVTQPRHAAHPAVLSLVVPISDELEAVAERARLHGRFGGNREAFERWRQELGDEIRRDFYSVQPLLESKAN